MDKQVAARTSELSKFGIVTKVEISVAALPLSLLFSRHHCTYLSARRSSRSYY